VYVCDADLSVNESNKVLHFERKTNPNEKNHVNTCYLMKEKKKMFFYRKMIPIDTTVRRRFSCFPLMALKFLNALNVTFIFRRNPN
jgi:hypothetical protein